MAHFAKVENGVVTQVIVIDQETLNLGHWGDPAQWKQTSYNTRGGIHYGENREPDNGVALRKNYASIGHIYDSHLDAFIPPTPYPSWVLDEQTCQWVAPVPRPQSDATTGYKWDEDSKSWVAFTKTQPTA